MHRHGLVYVRTFKVFMTLKTKKVYSLKVPVNALLGQAALGCRDSKVRCADNVSYCSARHHAKEQHFVK